MGNMKRIAVIEKDDMLRIMLERLLGCLGYEAVGYDSPVSFPCTKDCCTLGRRCFDALIINYRNNTDLDGVDFVIHQENKNCKISKMAVMSGSWDNEGLQKSRALKCKLLTKPFSIEELKDWLES
ncbi:MAG: hypothetical protein WAX69_17105 [Victivallales bacterium]